MKFYYGLNDFRTIEEAQKNCYLLTNGLGGFSSLTMAGSNARNDQALLMGVSHSPNMRYHLITNVKECLYIDGKKYDLSTQQYVNHAKNETGYEYLIGFSYEYQPVWTYLIEGITIRKTIVMQQQENCVAIQYEIENPREEEIVLELTPLFQGVKKGERCRVTEIKTPQVQKREADTGILTQIENWMIWESIAGESETKVELSESGYIEDLYYEQDARDGRDAIGTCFWNHVVSIPLKKGTMKYGILFDATYDQRKRSPWKKEQGTVVDYIDKMIQEERQYGQELVEKAGLKDQMAQTLVRSANQYLSYRTSTDGLTILAGFPFFGDWGRDTMIALMGCTIATKQYDAAKSILRTFARYCRNGLMPNIFPESGDEPLYNTVDAALLFFEAVYQYLEETKDHSFCQEMYPVMKEILKQYQAGTKYHIYMDKDSLIHAGEGLEQVTWMDVRFEDILPTPRHGKPVEVNAYWYNAWCVYGECNRMLGKETEAQEAEKMASQIRKSFLEQFWCEKGYLFDVVSGESYDRQIRCNQVWALSLSHTMPDEDQARQILNTIRRELYTPYGLRSLSPKDPQFIGFYGGTQFKRDMAYHQGTVWGYPLGAFYLAEMKYAKEPMKMAERIREELGFLESSIREGCIGHIAEIFDGKCSGDSKGCFAQAWSTGELLRVFKAVEDTNNSQKL